MKNKERLIVISIIVFWILLWQSMFRIIPNIRVTENTTWTKIECDNPWKSPDYDTLYVLEVKDGYAKCNFKSYNDDTLRTEYICFIELHLINFVYSKYDN